MTRKKQEKQGWGVPFLNKVARKVVTEQVGLESNPRGGDEVNRRDVRERSAADSRPDSAKVLRQGLPIQQKQARMQNERGKRGGRGSYGRDGGSTILSCSDH